MGNAFISGNLDVSETSLLKGHVGIGTSSVSTDGPYALDVSGNTFVSGNLDISNNLDVSGKISFHGDLDVSGTITLNGDLDIYGGNINLNGGSINQINELVFSSDGSIQTTAYTGGGGSGAAFSPPAVKIKCESNTTQILFTWPIPTYNNTGSPFPYTLTNIFAYLYADISYSSGEYYYNSYNVIPDNASNNLLDVSAIVLSNVTSNYSNGYQPDYPCIDKSTRSVFYYYDASFVNMVSNTYNNLTLWYTNNYPYPNVGDISYNAFTTSSAPSVVSFNTATQYSSSPNNITLYCYVDRIESDSTTTTTASLTNYKIFAGGYNSTGSSIRYPSELPDSGPTSYITTPAYTGSGTGYTNDTSFNLGPNYTGLPIFPSSPYTFYVAAQNNLNANYGPSGEYPTTGTFMTEAVPTPSYTLPTSTNPLFNPSNITYTNNNNNIYLVSDENSPVQYDVIDISSITTDNSFCSVAGSFIVPVQSASNLGLSGENYDQSDIFLTITGEVVVESTSNSCSQSINGFYNSTTDPYSYTYQGTITNGITLTTSVSDYYYESGPQCNQGFYLMAPPVMNISSSILSPTNNLYTATLTTAQNPTYAGSTAATYDASYNFYCDKINSTPNYVGGLGGFSVNNTDNYYAQVSGIYVMYTSPTFTITDLSLSNMGDYFYRSPLVSYDLSGGATTTTQETNLDNVTGYNDDSFNETISITNDGISGILNQTQWFDNITLNSITYQNIYGSTTTVIDISISTIVDYQSYYLAYNIIPPSIPSLNTSYSNGYRVWSAPSLTTNTTPNIIPYTYIYQGSNTPYGVADVSAGYSTIPYSNIWDISQTYDSSGVYQELLIANGYFTTNNEYYLDYSGNYSGGIPNTVNYLQSNMYTSGYRYATFAWTCSPNTISKITISINFSNTMYLNSTTGYAYFDQATSLYPLQLVYRLGDTEYTTYFGEYNSTGNYYPNTSWISLNYISSVNGTQMTGTAAYNNNNTLYFDSSPTITPNASQGSASGTFTYTTGTFPTSIYDFSSTGDIVYLYVRIGMPYGNYGFNKVQAFATFSQ